MTIYIVERDTPSVWKTPEVFVDGAKAIETVRSEYNALMNELGTSQETADKGCGAYGCYWEFAGFEGSARIDSDYDADVWQWRITEREIKKVDWFHTITDRLRDYSEGDIWSTGDEILCKTESAADALADLLESLYRAQGEEVLVNTGYYDPEEDARNNEVDRYTGWWYVNIG